MGLYPAGHITTDPVNGPILYNSCLSNPFKLKLGNSLKLVLVEMKAATGKEIVHHIINLAKVIPAGHVTITYPPLLITMTQTSEGSNENERVEHDEAGGKKIDSSNNVSSDWVNRIGYIPHIYWVQMLVSEIRSITMSFRSASVWAHQPNLPQCT